MVGKDHGPVNQKTHEAAQFTIGNDLENLTDVDRKTALLEDNLIIIRQNIIVAVCDQSEFGIGKSC